MRLKQIAGLALISLTMGCSKVQQLAQSVSLESLNIATATLSPGVVAKYYSDNLTAAGGSYPYTFSLQSGSLPSGLTLSATGEISGTPAAISSATLTYVVTDSKGNTATKDLSITISNQLSITTLTLPPATVSVAYSQAIAVTGGTGTYTYSASGLPSGFVIDSVTGIISGISATPSSSSIVVTVVDTSGLQDSKNYTFSVTAPPTITTTSVAAAGVTQAYSVSFALTGGQAPFVWQVQSGTLPIGITLSTAGVLSGTAASGANVANSPFAFTVQVTDSLGQTDTQLISMTVAIPPRVIDDFRDPLQVGREAVTYSGFIRSEGGVGTITYSASGLPTGLSLHPTSGHISGTPAGGSAGTYGVTVTVTDSGGLTSNISKRLRVVSAVETDINFSAPIQTPIGLYNGSWAYPNGNQDVADLNGDGFMDVVWGARDSRGIVVLLGDGTGQFTKHYFQSPGNFRPRDVKIADMNNDGRLDIVTSTMDNRIEVYLANAAGWPNAPVTRSFNVGVNNYQFDIGDLNGDGAKDIVYTSWTNNTIRVAYNCLTSGTVAIPGATGCNNINGTLNLHLVNVATLGQTRGVIIHDFDGDGNQDIIASSYNTHTVGILRGGGNGTYSALYTALVGASNPRYLAKADMNGDGRMDLVVTGNNAVAVMLNSAGVAPQTISLSSTAYAINDLGINSEYVDTGDLNGDGFPDVAFSAGATAKNSLGFFMNDGAGGLSNRTMIDSGYQTFGVRLASVLASSVTLGRPDLITGVGVWVGLSRLLIYPNMNSATTPLKYGAKYFNAAPSTFVQTHGAAQVADFNADGFADIVYKVGGAANLMLGSSSGAMTLTNTSIPTGDIAANWWHGRQMATADVNGDGHPDIISANWNNGGLGSVTTVLSNGDGTFGSQSTTTVDVTGCAANMGARSVDTGDFNKDGKLDLLVGAGCNSPSAIPRAYVFFGRGDGTFDEGTRKELVGTSNYVYLVLARDVNKDGITDVVLVSNDSVLRQYTSDGAGNFTLFGQADFSMSSNLTQISAGDLDKNGYLDYVVSSQSTSSLGRSMSTGTGSVSGGSTTTTTGLAGDYNGQPQAGSLMVDFDEDGNLDVITMRRFQDMNPANRNGGGGFHFYKNSGTGTLAVQSKVVSPAAYGAYSEGMLTASDLNNDGKIDIVNTNAQNSIDSGIGVNLK